ncbi:hypothetical protein [Polluticaenibacter yanchengensis]|uniref:RCC1 repeat-containing protein n=1 Tax=Polluticaenibacter yanchengensis TaxID=3014562 RepID=A0ABT4UR26_9BACT|nr:hypothetical protein [Chitinophagaceae bacterium LY-5]
MKKITCFGGTLMRTLSILLLLIALFNNELKSQTSCFNEQSPLRRVASSFHSTIIIDYKNEVMYWGDGASTTLTAGTNTNVLIPTALTGFTGNPVAVAAGSVGSTNQHQLFLLTTTNLYGWGFNNGTISSSTSSNVGITTIALPAGISATDIIAFEAAAGGLAIVTTAGNVYIKQGARYLGAQPATTGVITNGSIGSYTSALYGRGGAITNILATSTEQTNNTGLGSLATNWQQVLTAPATPLINVIKISLSQLGAMALTADNKVYTWGTQVYLGNGSGPQDLSYATQMALPQISNVDIQAKDININTKTYISGQTDGATHFILGTNGLVYGVGEGYGGILGQSTAIEGTTVANAAAAASGTTWATVKKSDGSDITGATMISSNNPFVLAENTSGYAAGVLTTSGEALLWGVNHYDMLGNVTAIPAGTYSYVYRARQPNNIANNSNVRYGFLELGGHTTIAFLKESTKYSYLGHLVRGSMGDGTNGVSTRNNFDGFSTAPIYYCQNTVSADCPPPSAKDLIASSSLGTTLLDNHSSVFAWGANAHPYTAGADVPLYGSIPSDYLTGIPVGLAAGTVVTSGTQNSQFWLHSTGGIYGWGYSANTIVDATAGQVAITQLALPSGVAITDVSFIRAAKGGIALVTNSGAVWIKGGTASSINGNVYGDGTTTINSAWHQVKTNASTSLTGVVELSFAGTSAMALTSTGIVYAWGTNVYTGTSSPLSAAANRNFATPVFTPAGVQVKTVEILQSATNASQFLLTTTGSMYSVGDNSNGILAIGNTTAQTSWQQVSTGSGTILTGVTKITSTNHTAGANGMAALTLNNNIYVWGNNATAAPGYGMLNHPTNGDITYATLATNGANKSNVELGGQFSLFFERGTSNIMFTGNNSRGSAGTTAIPTGTVTTSTNAIAISNCAGDVYTISGSLLNDINGTIDGLANGSAITGTTLHAVLLDPAGIVLESNPLSATGTFGFTNYMAATYSVRISYSRYSRTGRAYCCYCVYQ